MRRDAAGFSLLELMAVVSILGVLLAVAFPSFTYLSSTTRIKSASTEVYLSLIRARNEAVKRNRLVSIRKSATDWQDGWQIIADSNNDGTFDPSSDLIVASGAPLNRITITEQNGLSSVVFLTSGRIQGATVPELEVTSEQTPDMKRCISADVTGRPYTQEGACP